MKYWIIFLMLVIIWAGLVGCSKHKDKYRLKGFFNIERQNETN
jgi:hypothetical protein